MKNKHHWFLLPSETSTHSWVLDIFYHLNCNFIYHPPLLASSNNRNSLSWSLILVIPLNCTLLKAREIFNRETSRPVQVSTYIRCAALSSEEPEQLNVSCKLQKARCQRTAVSGASSRQSPVQSPLPYPLSPGSSSAVTACVTPAQTCPGQGIQQAASSLPDRLHSTPV